MAVADNSGKDSAPEGTESHDPAYPPKFLEFMRKGWRDTELPVALVTEAPNYSKRRSAVSAAFPGETIVIPSGREMVRANDTSFPFRPGSDFVYLTGEHEPESVLVLRPNGLFASARQAKAVTPEPRRRTRFRPADRQFPRFHEDRIR